MPKSSHYRGVTLFRPTGKWRAQISAGGKTTSLGDHDTEADAARAFDRAAINKAGMSARTNFDLNDYAAELEELQAMSQQELVAMLRSRARKSGTQTSHYRGVSLLKQTGKWHAQINVGGKQVHLGFFATEELAGRAYDRAAINKGARDGGKIITNFDIDEYQGELAVLRRINQEELVAALANDSKRRATMEMLAGGFAADGAAKDAEEVFGRKLTGEGGGSFHTPEIDEMRLKAERAAPKPTAEHPLYANFGKGKEGAASGSRNQGGSLAAPGPASPPRAPPLSPSSRSVGFAPKTPSKLPPAGPARPRGSPASRPGSAASTSGVQLPAEGRNVQAEVGRLLAAMAGSPGKPARPASLPAHGHSLSRRVLDFDSAAEADAGGEEGIRRSQRSRRASAKSLLAAEELSASEGGAVAADGGEESDSDAAASLERGHESGGDSDGAESLGAAPTKRRRTQRRQGQEGRNGWGAKAEADKEGGETRRRQPGSRKRPATPERREARAGEFDSAAREAAEELAAMRRNRRTRQAPSRAGM